MNKPRHKILFLGFLLGFSSLVYEIYSVKVLFLYFSENSQAVSLTISAFLAGLACSGYFFTKLVANNTAHIQKVIISTQAAMIIYSLSILRQHEIIPVWIDHSVKYIGSDSLIMGIKVFFVWIFLFIPAFLMGGSFPLLLGSFQKDFDSRISDIGNFYFWDGVGAILGSFLTGFVIIPKLGLSEALWVPALINMSIIFLVLNKSKINILGYASSVSLLIMFYFYGLNMMTPSSPEDKPTDKKEIVPDPNNVDRSAFHGTLLNTEKPIGAHFGKILFEEPSPFGMIRVGSTLSEVGNGDRSLYINYRAMCGSGGVDDEYIIGKFGARLLSSRVDARVLNIGLGCGLTASALNDSPNIKNLVVAEINPVIVKAAEFFKSANHDLLNSPKLDLQVINGQDLLRQSRDKFDLILIDVEEPDVIHSSLLYTKEYTEIIKNRLSDKGFYGLWSHRTPDGQTEKILFNTLKSVFPYVEISFASSTSFHMFCSMDPLASQIDANSMLHVGADKVLRHPTKETNTIENRILESIFDSRNIFNIPKDYKDKYLTH